MTRANYQMIAEGALAIAALRLRVPKWGHEQTKTRTPLQARSVSSSSKPDMLDDHGEPTPQPPSPNRNFLQQIKASSNILQGKFLQRSTRNFPRVKHQALVIPTIEAIIVPLFPRSRNKHVQNAILLAPLIV